jgi:hypothetical protein
MPKFTPTQAFEIAKNIQGWMRREELEWLNKLARKQGALCNWVEVGSWKGRSLVATGLGLPGGAVLSAVESFTGSKDSPGTHSEVNFPIEWVQGHLRLAVDLIRAYRFDVEVDVYAGRSLDMVGNFNNGSQNVVFIDGAHNEKAVTEDIEAWRPKVRPGGVLCGHDRGNRGVPKALKKTVGEWKEGAGSIWWVKI